MLSYRAMMDDTPLESLPEAPSPARAPHLLASGLVGLVGAGLLAALAAWLVSSRHVRPPFEHPIVTLAVAAVFGGLSVLEVPIMVFALRRLLVERTVNRRLVIGLNGVYVLFAAVYALPVFLITGSQVWGWLLSALALVRFATSLILVRAPRS